MQAKYSNQNIDCTHGEDGAKGRIYYGPRGPYSCMEYGSYSIMEYGPAP